MKKMNSMTKTAPVSVRLLIWATLPLASAALMTACSSSPKDVGNAAQGEGKPANTASIEAKQLAAEQEAAYVVEIEFSKKSSKLSAASREKIEALYKTVARPERLKGVKVIAWADDEYPSKKERKLSFNSTELAKSRAEAVQNFLKKRNTNLEFELYNMAKRPGTFSEFVGTADARIKDSLERAGISTTAEKSTPKARKTIVMLLMGELAAPSP